MLGTRLATLSRWEARRRAVLGLVVYLLVVHGLVLVHAMVRLTDLDGWPFTSYTIAAPRANLHASLCLVELRGVDPRGDEWPVDPLAWTPLHASVVHIWLNRHAAGLTAPERAVVLGFLLAKAEAARQRLRAGEPIGFERRLGPDFSAPYWWLLPRVRRVPEEPFVGLRVYRACRVPLEAVRDPARVTRTLVAEQGG